MAELFGVGAEDIAVRHLEEFPGRALVLVCVGMFTVSVVLQLCLSGGRGILH